MHSVFRIVIFAACLSSVGACERREDPRRGKPSFDERAETSQEGIVATWQAATRNWPESSRKAAREMAEKYGPPDEIASSQLIWTHGGPWKRSILSREEVHHEWPSPHVDVLEQVIDFRVPPDMVDDLAKFDGSVMVERTKGELSARCGGEAANFLAINLARDIVDERSSVENARAFYEKSMKEYAAGEKPDYMTGLKFKPSQGTADPDRAVASK